MPLVHEQALQVLGRVRRTCPDRYLSAGRPAPTSLPDLPRPPPRPRRASLPTVLLPSPRCVICFPGVHAGAAHSTRTVLTLQRAPGRAARDPVLVGGGPCGPGRTGSGGGAAAPQGRGPRPRRPPVLPRSRLYGVQSSAAPGSAVNARRSRAGGGASRCRLGFAEPRRSESERARVPPGGAEQAGPGLGTGARRRWCDSDGGQLDQVGAVVACAEGSPGASERPLIAPSAPYRPGGLPGGRAQSCRACP